MRLRQRVLISLAVVVTVLAGGASAAESPARPRELHYGSRTEQPEQRHASRQHVREVRAREREQERRRERRERRRERRRLRRYYAQPEPAGLADGPFYGSLPSWAGEQLVQWRGITLQVDAMRSLQRASLALGYTITGNGYRSHATQCAMAGNPLAAPCGHSYHEKGLAIDLSPGSQTAAVFAALAREGWQQLDGEPWHWSYRVSG